MIWALAILLAVSSIGAVVWPLLRPKANAQSRAEFDKEIYRDQLAEIDRDLVRGAIGDAEAKAARAEIGRRLLAVANETAEASMARPALRKLAVLLVLALPVAGVALYADRGAPGLPGQPLAERRIQGPDEGDSDRQQIVRFAQSMRERTAKDPNDLEAWIRLAQAAGAIGQTAEALTAWRKADEIAGKPPEIAGLLGEAAVAANDGNVTPEAEAAFARVLEAAPGDPRARFFTGLARLQAGQARDAVRIWFDLLAASPKDAPWVETVRARMEEAAKESRINLRSLRASRDNPPAQITLGPPAIVPPGGAGIAALPDADRLAAIRTMVESLATRLEAQPDDLDGWRRLARSWRVLGEKDKALSAYARTAAIVPNNIGVLQDYADALLDLVPESERLPEPGRVAMARLLELEPANPAALWLNGLDAANAGNKLAATALWQRLLDAIPADSPARADLTERIEKLKRAE